MLSQPLFASGRFSRDRRIQAGEMKTVDEKFTTLWK